MSSDDSTFDGRNFLAALENEDEDLFSIITNNHEVGSTHT